MYPSALLGNLSLILRVLRWLGGQAGVLNTGGPASRTRVETIRSSLLGNEDGPIRCPRVAGLGLDFRGRPAVQTMRDLLERTGFSDPEQLRRLPPGLPARRLICARATNAVRLDVLASPPEQVLRQALMLGLCTTVLFDPARPVLWTEASLQRCLELFEPEGFYP